MASIPQLKKDFTALLKQDRLSHGYLFFGEALESTRVFLESFAVYLEEAKWESSVPLSDARIMHGQKDDLGIDTVRGFQEFLYRTPVRSPKRLLIIHRGDMLTPHAQNAILKIVEEPPAHALIMMTVPDPGVLIPPLLSRFQKLFVSGQDERVTERGRSLLATWREGSAQTRKEFLKELVENDQETQEFLTALLNALRGDATNNARALGALLSRITSMAHYSTNRRLQIEAALLELAK